MSAYFSVAARQWSLVPLSLLRVVDHRPYLHVYLVLVSLYMETVGYYHISLFPARSHGKGLHLHTSKYLDLRALCGQITVAMLPHAVLNSVPTVPTPITSSRLLVSVILK